MTTTRSLRLALLTLVCGFLLSSAVTMHAQRPANVKALKSSTPGVFDFYLFNLSWSPQYCATGSGTECTEHLGFVVHGLWPQNNNGTYPESCSKAAGPANPSQYLDLIPDLSLLAHEWSVHGTCSGLGPDAFFGLERQAFHEVVIPKLFQGLNHSVQMKPADIIALFQQSNPSFPKGTFALTCGGNKLVQVEACLTRTGLNAEACQGVTSCKAQTIQILPQTTSTASGKNR